MSRSVIACGCLLLGLGTACGPQGSRDHVSAQAVGNGNGGRADAGMGGRGGGSPVKEDAGGGGMGAGGADANVAEGVDAGEVDTAPPDVSWDLGGPDIVDAAPDMAMPAPLGLVGYWKLDETSGLTARDDSGSMNNGKLGPAPGVPSWSTGHVSGGLKFDGVNDVVQLETFNRLPTVQAAKSIVLWAKWDSTISADNNRRVMVAMVNQTSASGVYLGFFGARLAAWSYATAELAGVVQPTPGWHHIAYTFNATIHVLYVDGAEVSRAAVAPEVAAPTAVSFGNATAAPGSSSKQMFKGTLDDIRIYDRALSAAEVLFLRLTP